MVILFILIATLSRQMIFVNELYKKTQSVTVTDQELVPLNKTSKKYKWFIKLIITTNNALASYGLFETNGRKLAKKAILHLTYYNIKNHKKPAFYCLSRVGKTIGGSNSYFKNGRNSFISAELRLDKKFF